MRERFENAGKHLQRTFLGQMLDSAKDSSDLVLLQLWRGVLFFCCYDAMIKTCREVVKCVLEGVVHLWRLCPCGSLCTCL